MARACKINMKNKIGNIKIQIFKFYIVGKEMEPCRKKILELTRK
jgi:hypothetical protein